MNQENIQNLSDIDHNVGRTAQEIKTAYIKEVTSREYEAISSKELFGLDENLRGLEKVQIQKERHPLSPQIEDYVFDPGLLRRIMLSMMDNDPIMVVGEKGSGKSAMVEQLLARLNKPLIKITCSTGVLEEHLLGRLDYDGERVTSVDGAVTCALRKGYSVLLDEVSQLRPTISVGLNDCLEKGDLITLKHHGFNPDLDPGKMLGNQVIVRHPSSRIWATDNTGGKMARDPRYGGCNVMNEAVRSRFTYFKSNYLPKELELSALTRAAKSHRNAKQMEESKLHAFIEFANKMRYAQEKGECIGGFSLRELKRWVMKYLSYGDMDESFCDAAYAGMEESDQQLAQSLFHETFCRELKLPSNQKYTAASQLELPDDSNVA